MKKKIIIISTVLVVAAAVLVVALLCFKLVDSIMYSSFYDVAEDEFYIPDLMDGYVPQGFEYMKEEKVFLSCGYMSNEEDASRVYVIDRDGEEYYYTELVTDLLKPYTGHTGGIAYYGEYVYITGDEGIDVFSLEDILTKSTEKAPKLGTVNTKDFGVDPAYCFIYDDQLYTGNFHNGENYVAPESQKLNIEGRDKNNAVMLCFDLHTQQYRNNYYVSQTPVALYSMPDKVQGVCVIEGQGIAISASYGMSASNIYVHKMDKVKEITYPYAEAMIGVKNIPLYVIDSKTLDSQLEAPPMSEEIIYLDGKIWIMNESASNAYIFGKFTTGNYLYSVEYPFPAE